MALIRLPLTRTDAPASVPRLSSVTTLTLRIRTVRSAAAAAPPQATKQTNARMTVDTRMPNLLVRYFCSEHEVAWLAGFHVAPRRVCDRLELAVAGHARSPGLHRRAVLLFQPFEP